MSETKAILRTAHSTGFARALRTILLLAAAPTLCRHSAYAADNGQAAAEVATGFTADFAYYPYYNSAHISVDFTKLPDREAAKGIGLRIVRRGTGETLVARTLPAPGNFLSECDWPLPVLGEGEYEFVVRLEGTDAAERRVEFERHVFP